MKPEDAIGRDSPDDGATKLAIAKQLRMAVIDLSSVVVTKELLEGISATFARRYCVFPVRLDEDCLTVAISNPVDFDAVDSLRYVLRRKVEAVYCDEKQIRAAIDKYY